MRREHLSVEDFASFFEAVHGQAPFPWQVKLAEHVCEKGWPEALDVPTGAGKTAAIDVAVFHLALEAQRGPARRAAARIGFVVDRRLVVDDAWRRAESIARKLDEATSGILGRVASALRTLSERENGIPLRVARLRGGTPKEPDWARSPAQPTVVVSTVDQLGSRLLFRGYGISDRMKPIHAGLLGSDCVILLDEAHLSQPFAQTVGALREINALPASVAVCNLSATQLGKAPKLLSQEDHRHPILGRRLTRSKPAELVQVAGSPDDSAWMKEITDRAAARVRAPDGTARVVAVVVNRVARARKIYERLRDRLERGTGQDPEADVVLLIGRNRPIARDRRLEKLLPLMSATSRTGAPDRPLIVVGTQCIEAGADLDFDDLITEVAPLDSLRQRFGRLNRTGRDIEPTATILAASKQAGARPEPDPVYGEQSIAATWRLLQDKAEKVKRGKSTTLQIDFGIEASRAWLPEGEALEACLAPRANAPVLMPPFIDQWCCTSPLPEPDPDVSLFLHGPRSGPPDVLVVWRADLREENQDEWLARVAVLPPSSLEAVSLPAWQVKGWLSRNRDMPETLADLEGLPEPSEVGRHRPRSKAMVVRWKGADESEQIEAWKIRPGDTIVLPSTYGGCDEWGWNPESPVEVPDLAEEAARQHRALDVIRLWPGLYSDAPKARLRELLDELKDVSGRRAITRLLEDAERLPDVLRTRLEAGTGWRMERLDDGTPLLVWRRLSGVEIELGGVPVTEDDLSSRGQRSIPLTEHSRGVEEVALRFARQCGLGGALAKDVALAAFLHDAGKAHPAFQRWMYGGDELAAVGAPALAKSGRADLGMNARTRAGLPKGARHEIASLALAKAHPRFAEASDPELVLWLIGTHHGYGRPFFPAVTWPGAGERFAATLDDRAVQSKPMPELAALQAEWLDVHRKLMDRYGAWGLARLEAIVRLADHRRSEAEQEATNDD